MGRNTADIRKANTLLIYTVLIHKLERCYCSSANTTINKNTKLLHFSTLKELLGLKIVHASLSQYCTVIRAAIFMGFQKCQVQGKEGGSAQLFHH